MLGSVALGKGHFNYFVRVGSGSVRFSETREARFWIASGLPTIRAQGAANATFLALTHC